MPEEIRVNPTPIQRNRFDVAMELTMAHIRAFGVGSQEELQRAYLGYYAAVELGFNVGFKRLKDYLPEDLKRLVPER